MGACVGRQGGAGAGDLDLGCRGRRHGGVARSALLGRRRYEGP